MKRALRERVDVLAYRAGWALVQRLPEPMAYAAFDAVADIAYGRGGAGRLRANYARIRPGLSVPALDALTREGMRAAMRYYGEAFRLPALTAEQIADRVRVEGDAPVRAALRDGSVVAFLGHLGNWDLAGAWGTLNLGHVTTVAERLEPEQVYEEFLRFRTSLGMTIFPLTGDGPVFPKLLRAARRPGTILPLLADRDLTDEGVEVDFCGHRVTMAGGPAALALATGAPLHPVSIRHEPRPDLGRRRWGIVITFHDAVTVPTEGETPERIAAMTQACADALGAVVTRHTADWHMLARFFPEDRRGTRARGSR